MPYSFISCAVSSLAISGVPPFNGFVSKWFIYQGLVEVRQPFFLLVAMFGSALTLASFVKILHSVFLGRKPEGLPDPKPAGFAMALPMLFLSALCLIFGVVAALPFRYLAEAVGQTSPLGPAAALSFPTGYYSPTLATLLILVALAIGGLFYLLGRVMPIRTTTVFVGGEKLSTEATRYPGTGFYETIRNMGWLKTIYEDASRGVYDIYALGGYYGQKLVEVGRCMHNGVLSTYVAFCVAGLAVILFLLFW
jgi:NADH:ubiquinone oxidoreductase subunit 5 (subunit L)/multisubunit Na+/H+ antiporter MnhA subunit